MKPEIIYFMSVLIFSQVAIILLLVAWCTQRKTFTASVIDHGKHDTFREDNTSSKRQRVKKAYISESAYISDSDIEILLENKNICQSLKKVDVLFVVHSAIVHYVHRARVRTMFHEQAYYTNMTFRLLFVLGRSRYSDFVKSELNKHGDVLQGNFIDSYYNLTYKAVFEMKWISSNCQNVEYVVKLDDDVYVDINNFYKYIYHGFQKGKSYIMCSKSHIGTTAILRSGKYEVSKYQFRHYPHFPFDYCSGFAVVLPGHIIPALYKATFLIPYIFIDDLYLFGIACSLIDIPIVNGFNALKKKEAMDCFESDINCKIVFALSRYGNVLAILRRRQKYLVTNNNSKQELQSKERLHNE